MKKEVTIYMHRSVDENYDLADRLGISYEAARNLKYCCSEVAIRIEIDLETGRYEILGVE